LEREIEEEWTDGFDASIEEERELHFRFFFCGALIAIGAGPPFNLSFLNQMDGTASLHIHERA
jgi:hypothetical protein